MVSLLNVNVTERIQPYTVLKRDWAFEASAPWAGAFAHRLKARLFGKKAAPEQNTLKPPFPHPRWIIYFVYLPDAVLTPSHIFTLEKLALADAGLFVICALPYGKEVPPLLYNYAHAVARKGLSGFDFSAYAFGMHSIVKYSSGSDVLFLNDSVFGPFSNVDREFLSAKWDFTGYTGQYLIENHIQSYAFIIKNMDESVKNVLDTVLPLDYAYDRYKDVIFQQETRLARIASREMSVGAKWFSEASVGVDPSFFCAISLLETGFPFLKKSLLHRRPDIYQRNDILELLETLGHPRP